jgi:predicted TIM-barrel fold metal-dependent hydrolase
MRIKWLLLVALMFGGPVAAAPREPVIDMHLHAMAPDDEGPPPMGMCTPLVEMPVWDQREPYPPQFLAMFKKPTCKDPIWSPVTEPELIQRTIAEMEKYHVVGVLSGTPERVAAWRKAAPGRFLAGLNFNIGRNYPVEKVAALHAAGVLDVLAEVTTQYQGIAPTDPRIEPYWALAEKLDIPVGIHVGTGPPGIIYMGADGYRARLHSALTMEEVLVKHPKLRVYLMHAGYPMIDDLLALMYAHPQVYVDTAVIIYTQPRPDFYEYIRRITAAGFGKRIMFGSDQMVWPETIGRSIEVIEQNPLLTAEQKRDILFNNAARFLRLTPEQIAAYRRI